MKKKKKGCALLTDTMVHNRDGDPPECPVCNQELDGVTGAKIEIGRDTPSGERALPEPGALTVCCYCGTYLQFTADMNLIQAPLKELATLSPEARAIMDTIAERGRFRFGNRN